MKTDKKERMKPKIVPKKINIGVNEETPRTPA
jgi:hypothetical protein